MHCALANFRKKTSQNIILLIQTLLSFTQFLDGLSSDILSFIRAVNIKTYNVQGLKLWNEYKKL